MAYFVQRKRGQGIMHKTRRADSQWLYTACGQRVAVKAAITSNGKLRPKEVACEKCRAS